MENPQLDQFKCVVCRQIPPDIVYKCCDGHLFCCACANENHYLCTCLQVLTERENPLLEKLKSFHCVQPHAKKIICDYSKIGCIFDDTIGDVDLHIKECRYRPAKCVGSALKLWNCDYSGRHRDIADHILSCHDQHHRPFTHYQTATIPFIPSTSYGTLNLIQAYSHDFIFYFYVEHNTRQMLFAIYLLGKRKTANRFYYELTFRSPVDKFRQLKFTERCFSDEDVSLVNDEHLNPHLPNVIVISLDTITELIKDDQIHFQFKISEIPKKAPEFQPIPAAKKKEKPKEKVPVKKEIKKGNLKRIESGIPNAPSDGGKKPAGEVAPPGITPLSITSINKLPAPGQVPKESPCLTPSINKHEKNAFPFPTRVEPPLMQTNHLEAQTYKDPKSSKYYQQLYPTSSLSKPTIKK